MTETKPVAASAAICFPGVLKAALCIAYDNGAINRDRSETDFLNKLSVHLNEQWLGASHSGIRTMLYSALRSIDEWLNQLTEADLETACNGEELEAKEMLKKAPNGTDALLNDIFESAL